jgi:hypothetical protein
MENFINIQRTIGLLVDGLPEEGFTPKLLDTQWTKEAAIWYARMKKPRAG